MIRFTPMRLPYDILIEIADHASPSVLSNLARCNCALRDISIPLLYDSIHIRSLTTLFYMWRGKSLVRHGNLVKRLRVGPCGRLAGWPVRGLPGRKARKFKASFCKSMDGYFKLVPNVEVYSSASSWIDSLLLDNVVFSTLKVLEVTMGSMFIDLKTPQLERIIILPTPAVRRWCFIPPEVSSLRSISVPDQLLSESDENSAIGMVSLDSCLERATSTQELIFHCHGNIFNKVCCSLFRSARSADMIVCFRRPNKSSKGLSLYSRFLLAFRMSNSLSGKARAKRSRIPFRISGIVSWSEESRRISKSTLKRRLRRSSMGTRPTMISGYTKQ